MLFHMNESPPPIQPVPPGPFPGSVTVSAEQTSNGLPVVVVRSFVGGIYVALRLAPDLALQLSSDLFEAVQRITLCSGPPGGSA